VAIGTYSCGYSSGFSPDSLLILFNESEQDNQNFNANINRFFYSPIELLITEREIKIQRRKA